MAAGLAMLTALHEDSDVFNRIDQKTAYLHEGMATVLQKTGLPHTINRLGSMISVHFDETPVIDFETAKKGDNDRFKAFFHGMLQEGIYIAPSAYETWFITDALTYEDLDKTVEAVAKVATVLK